MLEDFQVVHSVNISLTHLIISAKATSRHQCERFSTLQGLRTACMSDSALASGELMKSLLDVVDFSPISRVDSNTAKERRLGHCSGLTKHFTWEMSNRDVSQTTHDLFNRLLHTVGSALWIRHKSLKELPNRLTQQTLDVLDDKHVIGFSRLDLLSKRSLCTHGVQSYDTSLQGQGLQQLMINLFRY